MCSLISVLVTGAGAPGIAGTIYALKNNPDGKRFRIVSTDINEDVVGKYLTDRFYRVPPPEDENYIKLLADIAIGENIKVIIPQTTREVNVLSRHTDFFANLGVAVLVSSHEGIKVANDKFLLLEKAKQIGVPCPRYFLTNSEASLLEAVKSLGYPAKKVVVKPRISNGMRGLRILTEEKWGVLKFLAEKPEGVEISLEALLEILRNGDWPELIVSEYLPGVEYTVDVFRGEFGSVAIPRKRLRIRSGISFDTQIEMRSDLIKYSKELAIGLSLKYCFGFQFKVSESGIPKLLECNPRVQGTMVASVMSGFNLIYYSVMEALGQPVNLENVDVMDGFRFTRYWGGIGINGGQLIGKV